MIFRRTSDFLILATLTCCLALLAPATGHSASEGAADNGPFSRARIVSESEELLWGRESPADPLLAREFLQIQANKGSVDAMRMLGEQLVWGWVIPQDVDERRKYLELAVDHGDDAAM